MLKELVKLANHLDSKGLVKEADYLDRIIKSADSLNPMQSEREATWTGARDMSTFFLKFDLTGFKPSTSEEMKYIGKWCLNPMTECIPDDSSGLHMEIEEAKTAQEIADQVNDALTPNRKQAMKNDIDGFEKRELNENYNSVDKNEYKVYCRKGLSKCTDIINLLDL